MFLTLISVLSYIADPVIVIVVAGLLMTFLLRSLKKPSAEVPPLKFYRRRFNQRPETSQEVAVTPLDELFKWLPEVDFAVLEHRFANYGRDYILVVEDCHGSNPGQHEIVFTHCVKAESETRVRDDVWLKSWSDEFTNYKRWSSTGEPDGYVWGTNWSLAYPGLRSVFASLDAAEWSRRLGKQMFEATLETDRFFLRLIFHSIRSRKISEKNDTISQVIHRL